MLTCAAGYLISNASWFSAACDCGMHFELCLDCKRYIVESMFLYRSVCIHSDLAQCSCYHDLVLQLGNITCSYGLKWLNDLDGSGHVSIHC